MSGSTLIFNRNLQYKVQKRTKTHKKEKGNQLKLKKRTVEMSLFIKIKFIPHCAKGSEEQGGNFAPPLDFGRTINCIPIRGADYARTTLPFPKLSNLPSALCKTFTYVNVFDIEMRLQLRLHAADCSVVCLKSQLSAIYTEFTYVICIIERRYFYDIART